MPVNFIKNKLCLVCVFVFGCSPKKTEKVQSDQNSVKAALLGSMEEFVSGMFSDQKMKSTRLETATLQGVFVTETQDFKGNKLSDKKWKDLWDANKSLGMPINCSTWFDFFISGDQEQFFPEDDKKEKHLLQYKICRGTLDAAPSKSPIVNSIKKILVACSRTLKVNSVDWIVYRSVKARHHASAARNPEQSTCTAWNPNLSFQNILGTIVHYSYTRECIRNCDVIESNCKGNELVTFREYSAFPTPELMSKMGAKSGNQDCEK
jgi:hypothetical protein